MIHTLTGSYLVFGPYWENYLNFVLSFAAVLKLKQKMNFVFDLITSTILTNSIDCLYLVLYLPISIMRQLWLLNRNLTWALISGVFLVRRNILKWRIHLYFRLLNHNRTCKQIRTKLCNRLTCTHPNLLFHWSL